MSLSKERIKLLKDFNKKYKLKFKNFELLNMAFSHTSYTNEAGIDRIYSYERLEFLGDAVLKLTVSELLYSEFNSKNEGQLSEQRAVIVSDKTIAGFARKLELFDYILAGKAEANKKLDSILACAFEALLGAIFLEFKDKGFIYARNFLIKNFREDILSVNYSNPKAELQEITQEYNHNLPEYVLLDEIGPAHDKTFTIGVFYEGKLLSKGVAKTKKEAEMFAAKGAVGILKERLKGEENV